MKSFNEVKAASRQDCSSCENEDAVMAGQQSPEIDA